MVLMHPFCPIIGSETRVVASGLSCPGAEQDADGFFATVEGAQVERRVAEPVACMNIRSPLNQETRHVGAGSVMASMVEQGVA